MDTHIALSSLGFESFFLFLSFFLFSQHDLKLIGNQWSSHWFTLLLQAHELNCFDFVQVLLGKVSHFLNPGKSLL